MTIMIGPLRPPSLSLSLSLILSLSLRFDDSCKSIILHSEWNWKKRTLPFLLGFKFDQKLIQTLVDDETKTVSWEPLPLWVTIISSLFFLFRILAMNWLIGYCGRFVWNEIGDKSKLVLCCLLSAATAAVVRGAFFSYNVEPNRLHD